MNATQYARDMEVHRKAGFWWGITLGWTAGWIVTMILMAALREVIWP